MNVTPAGGSAVGRDPALCVNNRGSDVPHCRADWGAGIVGRPGLEHQGVGATCADGTIGCPASGLVGRDAWRPVRDADA
eukprot:15171581-Alexandrium_andersonii.AAC.1